MTEKADLTSSDRMTGVDRGVLAEVGVCIEGVKRSGTYVLRDFQTVCALTETEGLELLPISAALKQYDWLHEKYYWRAVSADVDEITARCALQAEPHGFFARVRKGTKVTFPCQAGVCMASAGIDHMIHNIVILEEDSEFHLITGCVSQNDVNRGNHFAVSEQYVGRNAVLTSTMIHHWDSGITVCPHAGTIVEEGGVCASNYISLQPAGNIRFNPQTWLDGKGASAKCTTIILGSDGSMIETGDEVYLNAKDTRAELAYRGVCTGGCMVQKGLLIGNNSCRAHVDCANLMLDPGEEGFILSIPGLKALHSEARMSHEASVGKIFPEQVAYLQTRGMKEQEAISMIIRGFLGADIESFGPELDARIAEISELAGSGDG